MKDLEARLRQHYDRAEMSAAGLERAGQALAASMPIPAARQRPARRPLRPIHALAPILVLGLGIFLLMSAWEQRTESLAREALATEIAFNHNKLLGPEFEADTIEALPSSMTALDFSLIASARIDEAGLTLRGARYCSIGGNIAAQIRLADAEGRPVTLYQLRPPEDGASIADEVELQIDGVSVLLWREAGLLMGLARAAR